MRKGRRAPVLTGRPGTRIAAAALLALLAAAGDAGAQEPPLARVGEGAVSAEAFTGQLRRSGLEGAGPEQQRALLERLVRIELLYRAALAEGLDKDPEVLASLRQLIANRFAQQRLDPKIAVVTITPEEAQARYETRKQDYASPAEVRAAVVRIAVPKKVSAQKHAELEARAAAAREEALRLPPSAPGFGSVAVKYSDDQATRFRGGDSGWMHRGGPGRRWPAAVEEAIFALTKLSEIGPVVAADDGFYLVKLTGRRESALPPFAQVRARIEHELLQERKQAVEREFLAELEKRFPVVFDEQALADYWAAHPRPARLAPPPLPAR